MNKIIDQIEKRLKQIRVSIGKFNQEFQNGNFINRANEEKLFQEQTILHRTLTDLKALK